MRCVPAPRCSDGVAAEGVQLASLETCARLRVWNSKHAAASNFAARARVAPKCFPGSTATDFRLLTHEEEAAEDCPFTELTREVSAPQYRVMRSKLQSALLLCVQYSSNNDCRLLPI